jgi:uroporphyrin-III C-methyltransferase / precorrin-2 dehydrogenase / sirohydrochlorin ferrochelatase
MNGRPGDPRPEDRTLARVLPRNRVAVPSPLFPVFLKLEGRPVLLVGGGRVAAGKLASLLAASADLTVVSPRLRPEFARPGLTLHLREFAPADVDRTWFVVAAATPEVNRRVAEVCAERRIFVNVVDDPELASAYTAGVLRRGDVTLAVSTGGMAPALAGLLREGLESLLPWDLAEWAEVARRLRQSWKANGSPIVRRRPLLLEALNEIYARRRTALEAAGS